MNQPPNQPPHGTPPGGYPPPPDSGDDRTQVVRPGQMPDNGPERTQMMPPGQPPQRPQGGGFDPAPSPPGGYPHQGGGFNPGSPPGGFQPGPPQGYGQQPPGGFNPASPPQGSYQPGGQGGFSPGGPQQGGFGQQPGGYPHQGGGAPGFGPAASDNDKLIAMIAGGSAIVVGLIMLILSLSNIGYIFDLNVLSGLILVLVAVLSAGLIGGGALIFMRNKLGPLLGFGCGAAIAGLQILSIIVVLAAVGIFVGGSLVGLILVAIPTVLCFMPQTKNYVSSGGGPQQGFGQQGYGQQQQGGYGRPF